MPNRPPSHADRIARPAAPERQSARERGYDAAWDRYSRRYRQQHPLCVSCVSGGHASPSEVVDHITPHRGDETLFWDPENHQALCSACHNRKTAREDGGFGNRRKLKCHADENQNPRR